MEQHYSLKELSEKFGISTRTLQRQIKAGVIPAKRIGRKYLVSEKDLQHNFAIDRDTSLQSRIQRFCESKSSEMTTLLQRLVSISSESETDGEERVATFLKEKMEAMGIRSLINGAKESVTVQGSFGYKNKGILFDCPIDTTPAGELAKWTYPPFDGVVRDGKMYGRGTADCKAGIVCMIYAVLALKEYVNEDKVRIELVFDGGEQNGAYCGMKNVLQKGLHVRAGIIGYAGTMQEIAIGARGYHRYKVLAHGRSSHTGSRDHYGINAISNMARLVTQIEKLSFPKSKDKLFPFGSRLTFAQIQGGTAINIVPDSCWAGLDVRVTPEIRRKDVEKILNRVISGIRRRDKNFDVELEYTVGQEGYVLRKDERIATLLSSSVNEITNTTPTFIANGPAHIGNLLYEHGIPVVVFGPKGGHVHSYDEFVEISSLPKTATVYADAAARFFDLV